MAFKYRSQYFTDTDSAYDVNAYKNPGEVEFVCARAYVSVRRIPEPL